MLQQAKTPIDKGRYPLGLKFLRYDAQIGKQPFVAATFC